MSSTGLAASRAAAFEPSPWLRGSLLQTAVPALWPPPRPPGAVEARVVAVASDAALRLDVSRPAGRPRGTLVLVHGMGGSARSPYMLHTLHAALRRGWAVVRVNLRNCGGTEALSSSFGHAGRSDDLEAVLAHCAEDPALPAPRHLIGYSLGANMVLRYGSLAGRAARAEALVAINPPIDLERCALALEAPRLRHYQAFYTWGLCRHVRAIRRVRELPGPPALARRVRTVRRFDELFTAPLSGYASVGAYYQDASSGPLLEALRSPTMIVSSRNDPVIPAGLFEGLGLPDGVRLVLVAAGGHVGYWQRRHPRFWAGELALDFIEGARA